MGESKRRQQIGKMLGVNATTEEPPTIDFEKMWNECMQLLDAIEFARHDPEEVSRLCKERFAVAERQGLKMMWLGTPGRTQ